MNRNHALLGLGIVITMLGLCLSATSRAHAATPDEHRIVQLLHDGCGPIRCHQSRSVTTYQGHGLPILHVTQRRSHPVESRSSYTVAPWTRWSITSAYATPVGR